MLVKTIFSSLLATGFTAAHMQMSWPYPLRSEFDPENSWDEIDYSMTNPLHQDGMSFTLPSSREALLITISGSDFPCKGYQNDPWRATAEYDAGAHYNMTLAGSATHGGGSCQLSLSYDNGATFKVIKSMEGGCPLTSEYDFDIPANAPSGHALFAWTWFNLVGNREMYMNCAQVQINGGSGGDFASTHPDMFVANVDNGCQTVEGKHTVFAHPGDHVVYGQGIGPDTPPFPNCFGSDGTSSSSSSSSSSTTAPSTMTTTNTRPTATSAPTGTVPQWGQVSSVL